jgi:hypothetical protein
VQGASSPAATCEWKTLNYKSTVATATSSPPGGPSLLSGSFEVNHGSDGYASFSIKLETATYWRPKAWDGGHDALYTSNLTCSVPQNPAGWECTSPSCTVGAYVNGGSKQVSITWTGAEDGGINTVAGYNVYYTTNGSDPTASSSKISFASTEKAGTKILTLSTIPSRGN